MYSKKKNNDIYIFSYNIYNITDIENDIIHDLIYIYIYIHSEHRSSV